MEQNYIIVIGLILAFTLYKYILGRIKFSKLNKIIESGEPFDLVDVRTSGEFNSGHIPGARNIPVDVIAGSLGKFKKDVQIVLYCQSGARASGAAATLKSKGYNSVWNFGGIKAWQGKLDR